MSDGLSGLRSAVDPERPCVARVFDYFLGGGVNFEADRLMARGLVQAMPDLPAVVRVNRAFAVRAVRFLVGVGIRQFIDLGSGLATSGAVHEVAREAGVQARVLYVDSDPVVAALNDVLVPERTCAVLRADLRDAKGVLVSPQAGRVLDPDRPTGLLMTAVLHCVSHADRPAEVVARYRDALAGGSALVLTHAEHTGRRAGTFEAARVYSRCIAPIHLRTRSEIAAFLNGWELVPPGLVPPSDWRPAANSAAGVATPLGGLAAVASKPVDGGQRHSFEWTSRR